MQRVPFFPVARQTFTKYKDLDQESKSELTAQISEAIRENKLTFTQRAHLNSVRTKEQIYNGRVTIKETIERSSPQSVRSFFGNYEYLKAVRRGFSPAEIKDKTLYEAFLLTTLLSDKQVEEVVRVPEFRGDDILLGHEDDEVTHYEKIGMALHFPPPMVLKCEAFTHAEIPEQFSHKDAAGLTYYQILGLHAGLSRNQVRGLEPHQIDAMITQGFKREDVLGLNDIQIDGLIAGLDREQVENKKTLEELEQLINVINDRQELTSQEVPAVLSRRP